MILEYLINNGPRTAPELANELSMARHIVDNRLADLRAAGMICANKSKERVWRYDGDFRCAECGDGPPRVKRTGRSKICGRCYHLTVYPRKKKAKLLAVSSRLSPSESGPTWAAELAQDYLMRRLA